MAVDKKVLVIVNTAVDSKMKSYKLHVETTKPKHLNTSQVNTATSSHHAVRNNSKTSVVSVK